VAEKPKYAAHQLSEALVLAAEGRYIWQMVWCECDMGSDHGNKFKIFSWLIRER
jgi:hypothetical protein